MIKLLNKLLNSNPIENICKFRVSIIQISILHRIHGIIRYENKQYSQFGYKFKRDSKGKLFIIVMKINNTRMHVLTDLINYENIGTNFISEVLTIAPVKLNNNDIVGVNEIQHYLNNQSKLPDYIEMH